MICMSMYHQYIQIEIIIKVCSVKVPTTRPPLASLDEPGVMINMTIMITNDNYDDHNTDNVENNDNYNDTDDDNRDKYDNYDDDNTDNDIVNDNNNDNNDDNNDDNRDAMTTIYQARV